MGLGADFCPQLSGPPVLCPTLLHRGEQPSLQPSSPPPSLASLASTGAPQRQLRCGRASSGTGPLGPDRGTPSCTNPSPSFALPSSCLTRLPFPSLLRSHSGECLHVVPSGDTDALLDVPSNPIIRVRICPHPQPVSRRWEANEKPFPSFSASIPLSSHFDETWPSVTVSGPLRC